MFSCSGNDSSNIPPEPDQTIIPPIIEPPNQDPGSWSNYHWARQSNPFTVKLGSNLSPAWVPYLNSTSSDWSVSSVLDTVVINGSSEPKSCLPTLGIIEICNSTYGETGWLGIAEIWVTSDHIIQATVRINDTYFITPKYNFPPFKSLVMCQEVGHTFGLAHQDEIQTNTNLGSCMDYSNNPAGPPSNERPNQHDYDELNLIYLHLDDITTVNAQPPLYELPPIPPYGKDFGRLKVSSFNSKTFVKYYSSKEFIVTHIIESN